MDFEKSVDFNWVEMVASFLMGGFIVGLVAVILFGL